MPLVVKPTPPGLACKAQQFHKPLLSKQICSPEFFCNEAKLLRPEGMIGRRSRLDFATRMRRIRGGAQKIEAVTFAGNGFPDLLQRRPAK